MSACMKVMAQADVYGRRRGLGTTKKTGDSWRGVALYPLLALEAKKSLFSSDLRKPLRASDVVGGRPV